jgi:ribosomal-protein-alanine N-acetyltransferase
MIGFISALWSHATPTLSEAGLRDAVAIAALHAKSFQRGWSEDEVEALLMQRNVVGHRALAGRRLAGFILSRTAADEAEILSVAVAQAWRGRGVAKQLLTLQLGRLAGLGVKTVFLEVGENNHAALRLYSSAGFREISRRPNYYSAADRPGATALVLRRDLVTS